MNQKKTKSNPFLKVFKLIDKKIVVPITKIVVKISNKFDKSGKSLENFLTKTNTLLFTSLFLAIATFIAIDQKILVFSESSAEVLRNQPVHVTYNSEKYVVEGLPSMVDITLIGSKADLYMAKQAPTDDVTIDLTNLKPGQHKVDIKYNKANGAIDYKVNPSSVTVYIYPKVSDTRTLMVDILNQDSLNAKLVINDVEIINGVQVDNDKVYIKGADYKLKKVATVKALIDVNNLAKQEVGTMVLKDVPLKAYDEAGNVVDVEIVPSKVDTNIMIASPSKKLPIKIVPVGEVAFGKAISSIISSETEVTVYGNEEALLRLQYVPVEINVQDLKEKIVYKSEITKPTGIKSMSINSLNITVSLDTVSNKDVEDVKIDVRNLGSTYKAQGMSDSDIKVIVNVKGVSSVLDTITSKDISAYVDLKGLGEGEHEVEVKVEGSDVRVHYLSKTKTIKVVLSKK